jgi:predicted nucleic acid-binding protein
VPRVGKVLHQGETRRVQAVGMAPKIYIETTVISYLTAWPSRDVVRAAHQHLTREWWETRRVGFESYVCQIVLQEVSAGDPEAAAERLNAVKDIPVLQVTVDVPRLAQEFIRRVPLPAKAAADAVHIAMAVVHGMDYLLTWNCTHIANAALRAQIDSVCRAEGYEPVIICTPEELLEKSEE